MCNYEWKMKNRSCIHNGYMSESFILEVVFYNLSCYIINKNEWLLIYDQSR